jgi:hypothetical protein
MEELVGEGGENVAFKTRVVKVFRSDVNVAFLME